MNTANRSKPEQRLVLAGILILALALRLVTLAGRGLEYDDAFSILLAEQNPARIIAGTAADTMPPGYYLALHLWMAVSRQLWFTRLLNVALSLVIVALTIAFVTRLFGQTSGLWSGLFAAVSPLQIFHAQGMRMYVLLCLALLGYAWFFVLLSRQDGVTRWQRRVHWAGVVLCGAAAMYSHNLAIFTLAALPLFLLIKREWAFLRRLLLALGLIGVLALPWLRLVPGQLAKVQAAFWTPRPGLLELLQALVTIHTNLPVPPSWLPMAVAVSLLAVAFVSLETFASGRKDPGVHLLVALALLPPLSLFLASYLIRPVFLPRPLMLSSLAYLGLAGRVAATARVRLVGYLIAALFLLAAGLGLPGQYGDQSFPRSPFQEATAALKDQVQPSDVVVHDNKLSYFPAIVYAPDLPQTFLPDPPGSPNDTLALATQQALGLHPAPDLATAVDDVRRVWFVVFQRAIQEYQETSGLDHPQLAWLEARFSQVDREMFNDLVIYTFTR